MNTTPDHDHEDLRYAEYVLGVLDADARTLVEGELARDSHAVAEVAIWQQRLLPLAEDVTPVAPPDYAWAHVRDALGFSAEHPARRPARVSVWRNLALWRWFALGASTVAAACLVVLLVRPNAPTPSVQTPAYMVARIQQDNGLPGWTVTMDPVHARMVVVPAAPNAIAAGRAPELWLIPKGGKPIAIGVFVADKATTLDLPREVRVAVNAQALLAVSVEPPGGSPTGQPTGPVVGKGELRGI